MDIFKLSHEIETEIIKIRRHLHQYPELSLEEFKTTEYLEDELNKIPGISISREGLKTGIIAVIKGKNEGKTIALRADMDALPIKENTNLNFASKNDGIMHACGHDIHTAILLGTAKILSQFKDQIDGTIKFFFQPAEEKLAGAKSIIKAGGLENPEVDAIIGVHTWPNLPGGTIGIKKGSFMASADEIKIKIRGKGGHAAHPEDCIDPIIIAAHILTKIQTIVSRETSPLDPLVITFGTINAGTASNIIPDEVIMTGTVRTVNHETHDKIFSKLERIVVHTAISMGGAAELEVNIGTPPLIADEKIVDLIDESAASVIGKANVKYLREPSMGGEDFAFYLEKIPGALIRVGTSNNNQKSKISLHNASIIFDEKAIITGIKVMSKTALNYLK
jgi:amidohydrolase/hippurate hydrolase